MFLTRFETRYNTILDSKIVKFSLIFIVPIVSTSDYRSIIEMRDVEFFFFQGIISFYQKGRRDVAPSHSVDFHLEKSTCVAKDSIRFVIIKVSRALHSRKNYQVRSNKDKGDL